MRIRIKITPQNIGNHVLPVNYQYPLSAWIYKVISEGNHAFAIFLHENGYGEGKKSFKLFTFSMIDFGLGRYRLIGDRIEFIGEELFLTLSFLIPKALEHFIAGLFLNQEFSIGDRSSQVHFRVKTVEVLPEPIFNGLMQFTTLSPVLVSEKVEGLRAARYLHPEEKFFGSMMLKNLMNKQMAFSNAVLDSNFPEALDRAEFTGAHVRLLSQPRKKGIIIKSDTPQQTQIIGYQFDFEIKAPPQLIRIGYHAGFGEKNSLGMGCCKVVTDKKPNQHE